MSTLTYMTNDYRTAKLSEANDALGAARDALHHARTLKAIRAAREDIEFWSNKVAFLTVPV